MAAASRAACACCPALPATALLAALLALWPREGGFAGPVALPREVTSSQGTASHSVYKAAVY